ncbi:hypothetical protein [Salininema proteolyticum]|uniref:Lipoprotein n=1 Tax=Salininema proteolyticum TaxID=1607685 RepID=A0ABV8TZY4_9ACTN
MNRPRRLLHRLTLPLVVLLALSACTGGESDSGEGEITEDCAVEPCDNGEGAPGLGAFEIPQGYLGVETLGALTPRPEGPWIDYLPAGSKDNFSTDTQAINLQHTGNWISYVSVGQYSQLSLEADTDDIEDAADKALSAWTYGSSFECTKGAEYSPVEVTYTRVDGFPAALATTKITWDDGGSCTTDTFEDVALLLVELEDGEVFAGTASIPESGTEYYDAALDALLQTTFHDRETLM